MTLRLSKALALVPAPFLAACGLSEMDSKESSAADDLPPAKAFGSITVYNADGYLEANDLGVNSYNNFSATPNDDGSYTINFGGRGDGRRNCIPITPGWNYAVRLYQPREEILNGSWQFPTPIPTS